MDLGSLFCVKLLVFQRLLIKIKIPEKESKSSSAIEMESVPILASRGQSPCGKVTGETCFDAAGRFWSTDTG